MKALFTISFCFFLSVGRAQELPATIQQQVENLGVEDIEDDALLQYLEFYHRHPLNLNTAAADELQLLRILTDLQIANLISYRALFGRLIDIYELQAVPGFDLFTIRNLLPYVIAGSALSLKETFLSRLRGGDAYALFRISRIAEKAKGYNTLLPTHYLGDRNHLLLRYRYQYKSNLQYGFVADKDAGEPFLKGSQKLGFDFYSVHFFARQSGNLKALAIGDYVVNLGQGLTQWQSLAFGKSADVINIKRQSPVLLPYRSTGEFYFNRGIGGTFRLNQWEVTGFVSYKNFSGNLAVDSTDRFTSFSTSGYYRTAPELADRNQLHDFSFGGNLSYQKMSFKVGLNAVAHRFSLPLQKRPEPYNYFAFTGRQTFNGSVDYSYTYRNLHLFGEAATDNQLNNAFIQGGLISIDPKVDISILYRAISKKYQALFGSAFTENTLPSNETGFYTGIAIRPVSGWELAAYADHYRFPFLKYRVNAPARGWDYLVQLTYLPNKKSELYLRYHAENKPVDEPATSFVVNYPVDKVRQALRLHYTTELMTRLSLKTRTEVLWFDKKGSGAEEGFLSFIEAAYTYTYRLKGNIRLQYFETGGYNSRIYAYESDVAYGFSVPAFYDKGFRYYLNIAYDATKRLTVWVKAAQTLYKNRQTIGSGLDEITGPRRTELKFQLRYSF